ncbi:MAG TPA: hypothetical protein VML96_11950 [Egibacteraceae bacterium]|nr:hypothetical protein [Egibacteraceae bacterium]
MKALIGSWDNRPHRLLAEVTALRTRVRELETELERARQEVDALRMAEERAQMDDMEVALSST